MSEEWNEETTVGIQDIEVEELSREVVIQEIDREARERLGMSFDKFLERYQAGDLEDTLATNELVILLHFAGFGRNGTAA